MPTVKYHLQGESKALEASLKKSRREFEKTELVADVYGITLKEAAAALRDVARAEKQAAHATNRRLLGSVAPSAESAARSKPSPVASSRSTKGWGHSPQAQDSPQSAL